jgi:DNA mismatch repair protein MutS2
MQDTLALLEWPEVFERLLGHCFTPFGQACWKTETFLSDAEAVRRHLLEVEALKQVLVRFGDPIITETIPDCRFQLSKITKGARLTESELAEVLRGLQASRLLAHFSLRGLSEIKPLEGSPLPVLPDFSWLRGIALPDPAIEYLESKVSPAGELLDSASPDLYGLRQRRRSERGAIENILRGMLTNPNVSKILQEAIITERDGRYVLPVKVEHKSSMPGIVHGTSSTGATLFIEPQAVAEWNNRLQRTQADIGREIQRLLEEISRQLEGDAPLLLDFLDTVGLLDKRLAAARLSRILDANPPEVFRDGPLRMNLWSVRHPLLLFNRVPNVVPNNVQLGENDVRTLVITGPNTGGKTVLLKTVGLCAMMAKAGLHLPCAEGSSVSLFDEVHADIGDQQNIAENLSTFSAHMVRLAEFVAEDTDLSRSLVLMDEIAAGTDPVEGTALAQAILKALYDKGAMTMVTTHLSELKLIAHQHPGFVNASVAFDAETLSPTYRLILGVPGASNALVIAERLGLRKDVIENARQALSAPVRESADLLTELENRNLKLIEELQLAESYRKSAQENYEKVITDQQQFRDEKRKLLQEFRHGLKSRIHVLEEEIKRLRKEMHQPNPTDQRLADIGGRLRKAGRQADEHFSETETHLVREDQAAQPELPAIQPGDKVFSRRLNMQGTVVQVSDNGQELTVEAGIIRAVVPVDDIRVIQGQGPSKAKRLALAKSALAKKHKEEARQAEAVAEAPTKGVVQSDLDVRGKRADEALQSVITFLDSSVVSGFETVGIIHGVGTGALRNSIRQYLKTSGYVKRFYPDEAHRGGDGRTIVEL